MQGPPIYCNCVNKCKESVTSESIERHIITKKEEKDLSSLLVAQYYMILKYIIVVKNEGDLFCAAKHWAINFIPEKHCHTYIKH